MDKISVIIPVYNVEKYLDECLNSIINQTYNNLEIILVNDGSTDNSAKKCDDFAKIDNRIRVIHQQNSGQSMARNNGLAICSGDYFAFIDSDDIIACDMLERLHSMVVKYNVECAECAYKRFEDSVIAEDKVVGEEVLDYVTYPIKATLKGSFSPSPCTKLYSVKIKELLNFPVGLIYEDSRIMYKVFFGVGKIAYTDYVGYYYRINFSSTTNQKLDDRHLELLDIMQEEIDFLLARKYDIVAEETRKKRFYSSINLFFRAKKAKLPKEKIQNCKNAAKLSGAKNTRFTKKDKILYTLFCASPSLYKFLLAARMRMKHGCKD